MSPERTPSIDPATRPVDRLPALDPDDVVRYDRHLLLSEVGVEGQRRLKGASVLCVGAGGLGSPLLLYLAAAGVGRIGIVDHDIVDVSNLQRQIIHGSSMLGKSKLESARARILDLNPACQVDLHPVAIKAHNALEILAPYDVVVDGTDNFPTRYLINDACCILGKPNVYGSIFKFEGQASVFNYRGGPNYRDLYPEPPPPGLVPSCAEGGVLGVLPGIIGGIQATETLKILLGKGASLSGRLLLYNALDMRFRELKLQVDERVAPITELIDYEQFCGVSDISEDASSATQSGGFARLDAQAVRDRLQAGWKPVWVDVRKPHEWSLVKLEEAQLFIPHEQVMAEGLPAEVAKDAPIVLQCRTGGRSGRAAAALLAMGYSDVTNLEGGIRSWVAAFRPDLPAC